MSRQRKVQLRLVRIKKNPWQGIDNGRIKQRCTPDRVYRRTRRLPNKDRCKLTARIRLPRHVHDNLPAPSPWRVRGAWPIRVQPASGMANRADEALLLEHDCNAVYSTPANA